ncbi:hypothetical protein [Desulfovibrio falkowii]|uniref:hypothetical protein n=1 Tax=Desulfovibrio TaxID=872 RepID=UPI00372D2DF2
MLTTLLDYMRNPPAGGTVADCRRWRGLFPDVVDVTVYCYSRDRVATPQRFTIWTGRHTIRCSGSAP